jgi:two-component sensor histidine kinase
MLNAIRHGDCLEMRIEILDLDSRIRIVCSDNGVGFIGEPKGFGTQIYNQATAGKWSLKRDTSKAWTVLTLDFAKNASMQMEAALNTP